MNILTCLLMILCLGVWAPARSPAQETNDVWARLEHLDLAPEQRKTLAGARDQLEQARDAMRALRDPAQPPDLWQKAQLDYAVAVRVVNRRIGEVLSNEQKVRFDSLSSEVDDAGAEPDVPSTEGTSPRLPPRPVQREEDYRAQAIALRTRYSQPSAQWPVPHLDEDVKPHFVELGLLPPMPYPSDNRYHPAKAALGKQLFFDPRLSGSGQISCSSCHDPDLGWADGRTVSFGHARTVLKRNAPTVQNAGQLPVLFWDGRASSLEQQAEAVLRNDDEMRSSEELIRERLNPIPDYANAFAEVFGSSTITLARVAQAIATFERTITSRASPFDSFLRGDTNALSDEAVRGLHLFRTTARCLNCHHGPRLTDNRFHNEGLTYYGRKYQDLGRYEITRQPADVGAFKTPTLRNIERTAPYMHLGLFDLDGVLNMYNAGMPTPRRRADQEADPLYPQKSHLLKPLGLNRVDLADLKAFLAALTETRQRMMPPDLPQARDVPPTK